MVWEQVPSPARRLILDTSSLTYRAFFALPASIRDDEGHAVNAVRGYCDMVANLVTSFLGKAGERAEHAEVLHAFDHDWRPAPRVAAYDGYKSTRKEDPPELPWQFKLLRALLGAFGQPVVEAHGWEADDAIGTLCAAASDNDRVSVVTGDRDLIQLVRDPVVRVLFTVSGVKKLATFDEPGVREKYGLPPQRYADFATLRGDPSDGLPGIRGVGEKTARDLIRAYPDLDTLAKAAAEGDRGLTPRVRESIGGSQEYLAAMQQVVPIREDVALTVDPGARDDAAVDALAVRHRLQGSVDRLRAALNEALGA